MSLGQHVAITAQEARDRVDAELWQKVRANQFITDAIGKRKTSCSFRFTTTAWFNLPKQCRGKDPNVTPNVEKSVGRLVKMAKGLGYKTRVYKLQNWTRVQLSWS